MKGLPPMALPRSLAIGDLIRYARERLDTADGLMSRYTFAGAEYFARMKEEGLYSIDRTEIENRVKRSGLLGIYKERIC